MFEFRLKPIGYNANVITVSIMSSHVTDEKFENVNIFHINYQSICNKYDEMFPVLDNMDRDGALIMECCLESGVSYQTFVIEIRSARTRRKVEESMFYFVPFLNCETDLGFQIKIIENYKLNLYLRGFNSILNKKNTIHIYSWYFV